jgi:hypothetical protein
MCAKKSIQARLPALFPLPESTTVPTRIDDTHHSLNRWIFFLPTKDMAFG